MIIFKTVAFKPISKYVVSDTGLIFLEDRREPRVLNLTTNTVIIKKYQRIQTANKRYVLWMYSRMCAVQSAQIADSSETVTAKNSSINKMCNIGSTEELAAETAPKYTISTFFFSISKCYFNGKNNVAIAVF
jgi:hypothetical protein